MAKNGKLTIQEHLGYAAACMTDSLEFAFISSFLMLFLTSAAGLSPAVAGILCAIGSFWNAVFNPVIGSVADSVRSRFGRRRALMLRCAVPMLAATILLFTRIPASPAVQTLYYAIMVIAFWSAYTGFIVPYLALGSEYTEDYDERTLLRLFSAFFNNMGSMFSVAVPPTIVAAAQALGCSKTLSWQITAGFVSGLALLALLVTFFASKPFDPPNAGPRPDGSGTRTQLLRFGELFRNYASVFREKPTRALVLASLAMLVCYQILLADIVYYFTYNLQLPGGRQTFYLLLRGVFAIALLFILRRLTVKLDKKEAMSGLFLFGSAGFILYRIFGTGSPGALVCLILLVAIGTCVYWDIMPSIYYDLCDYDRLQCGYDRRSQIISLQGFLEAAAMAIGNILLGFILQAAGFVSGADVQTETAQTWILNCLTVVPAICMVLSILTLRNYPIDRKRHAEIMRELDRQDRERAEEPPEE